MRGHQHTGGLRRLWRRVGRRAQQALDELARGDERALQALRDRGVAAGGVVDRAQQSAVLGEQADEALDHLACALLRPLRRAALDAVDEWVVGVGQQLRGEARQILEVPVEDRPRQPGLGHERADGQLCERALGQQRAGGVEDPFAREVGGNVRRAS